MKIYTIILSLLLTSAYIQAADNIVTRAMLDAAAERATLAFITKASDDQIHQAQQEFEDLQMRYALQQEALKREHDAAAERLILQTSQEDEARIRNLMLMKQQERDKRASQQTTAVFTNPPTRPVIAPQPATSMSASPGKLTIPAAFAGATTSSATHATAGKPPVAPRPRPAGTQQTVQPASHTPAVTTAAKPTPPPVAPRPRLAKTQQTAQPAPLQVPTDLLLAQLYRYITTQELPVIEPQNHVIDQSLPANNQTLIIAYINGLSRDDYNYLRALANLKDVSVDYILNEYLSYHNNLNTDTLSIIVDYLVSHPAEVLTNDPTVTDIDEQLHFIASQRDTARARNYWEQVGAWVKSWMN